ncbi:MAG: HD domain-containing phosphohydrolase [Sphaerochaetaceae bacterium]
MTVAFVLFSLVVGSILFTRLSRLTKDSVENGAERMGDKILDKIALMIDKPMTINEANIIVFERGMLSFFDSKVRDLFFYGKLLSDDEFIYSITYGTEEGNYYGSRRVNGGIEIILNDASTDRETWFYTINDDGSPLQITKTGPYDPREMSWYQEAVSQGESTFSPVMQNYNIDDLSVTLATPVYSAAGRLKGVLATHLLLSDINRIVTDAALSFNGEAFIVERESGELIANSLGVANYSLADSTTFKHNTIASLSSDYIEEAYQNFLKDGRTKQVLKGRGERHSLNIEPVEYNGLSWLIISSVEHSTLIGSFSKSIIYLLVATIAILVVTILTLRQVLRYFLKPLKDLHTVAEQYAKGDFTERLKIIRRDEIGYISASFNNIADELQGLINNLEGQVEKRTAQAELASKRLKESRERLQLILDTTAEGIYGVNLEGDCTFINQSALKLLGYNSPSEVLGKNMHNMVCFASRNKNPMPPKECSIFTAMREGREFRSDGGEVFWRSDGSCFDVAYFATPQRVKGEVIGAVVTFIDNTERRNREEEIAFLSQHDLLTGLYNRSHFENLYPKLDSEKNLPIAVLFADLNGLKITNDIFGHNAGDELIRKAGEVLEKYRRRKDLLARVGGDEFVMVLPQTELERAREIAHHIVKDFSQFTVASLRCNIAIGVDVKKGSHQRIEAILANAENEMYRIKSNSRSAVTKETIKTIMRNIFSRSLLEERHANAVRDLSYQMGQALNLPETELSKLARAAYYHDIGKITLPDELLKRDVFTPEEQMEVKQHAVTGFRILNLFDETLDLAEYVYGHHEQWDGSGHPRGLVGKQIPLISRIIAICESYERALYRGSQTIPNVENALTVIEEGKEKRFDPYLAEVFLTIQKKKAAD